MLIKIQRKRKISETVQSLNLAYFISVDSRRPSIYSQNASTKENDLSKGKDFTLQRRNMQLLPLNPNVVNHQSRTIPPLTQNGACAMNAKFNPCKEFTSTICKCKSYLKELQYNDKHLRSSEMNKVSSLKATPAAKRVSLLIAVFKSAE